jgi:hypothetical protein
MRYRHGSSLLELLMAATILVAGLLPLLLLNRSSNQITLDAYYEFLAVQLAQEPIEVFRSVGYPACTELPRYPLDTVTAISGQDDRYPAEAAMFDRHISLDLSRLPLCLVTVKVSPRAGSPTNAWLRRGKDAVVAKGVVPIVR